MTAMSSMTWERLDIILADGRVITLRSDDTIFMGSVRKPVQVDLTDQKGPFTYEIRVIEHASFTFSLEGISRACSHQLVRHRLASYTQQSQRYVEISRDAFTKPGTIQKNKDALRLYESQLQWCTEAYKSLLEMGIPKEDARFVMPNATKTNIIVTMNARELLHFFSLRCCQRAQWEIRTAANYMLELCKTAAPVIFEKAGPQCVRLGYCPEGELGCGKEG